MITRRNYVMSDDYILKNEVQLVRRVHPLGTRPNTDYLLGDDQGRKLCTTAFVTLPETWVRIAHRVREYSIDYSAMAWFVQFTMSPASQAISASILAGLPDHAAVLLRYLFISLLRRMFLLSKRRACDMNQFP